MPLEERDDGLIYVSRPSCPPTTVLEHRCEAYIKVAMRYHDDDDLTVNNEVDVSPYNNGAWVKAWVWVNDWDGPEIIEHFTTIDEWMEKRADR